MEKKMLTVFDGIVIESLAESRMVELNALFVAGNVARMSSGAPALQLNAFLNSAYLADYVEAAAQEWGLRPEDMIKRTGKGRAAKTFVHVSVALVAAERLCPKFHAFMHREFIEGRLHQFRSYGATEFVKLNVAIDDHLPGRDGKDNKGVFLTVAKLMRSKLLGDDQGASWNTANAAQTQQRYELEAFLSKILRAGLVRDFDHLKTLIQTF